MCWVTEFDFISTELSLTVFNIIIAGSVDDVTWLLPFSATGVTILQKRGCTPRWQHSPVKEKDIIIVRFNVA